MASEAPSWADQWGAGGINVMEDEDATAKKEDTKKPKEKEGFKTTALKGAKKVKHGISMGLAWVKSKWQRKNSSRT
ncbi:hypothetical protein F3Y22_tig00000132pilonHSYRG00216 [Hibiscus syriacus]|uniref:Uncharacterized protein n=1 Tax=Hibiscus syriacus TaxID=106335 RepID=A0A6A3D381_HIBSY|nr:hypothetical protein F3Y22_tig00110383pilonHSYRG00004 [Hibiscus syriacus]KAE8736235.1 hypothetical protein F3Y22_tig00000132pilonHSYRG00216 [Hibiscus syriacus]